MAAVAEQFFPLGEDGLRHNKRADQELAKWEERAEFNRRVGKKGGRPRKPGTNPDDSPNANPEETRPGYGRVQNPNGYAYGNLLQNPE